MTCRIHLHHPWYRKPTCSTYLEFDSHHPLEHKLSVVRTLFNRAESLVTKLEDKANGVKHVKSALKGCGYQNSSFKRACVVKEDQVTTIHQDSKLSIKKKKKKKKKQDQCSDSLRPRCVSSEQI